MKNKKLSFLAIILFLSFAFHATSQTVEDNSSYTPAQILQHYQATKCPNLLQVTYNRTDDANSSRNWCHFWNDKTKNNALVDFDPDSKTYHLSLDFEDTDTFILDFGSTQAPAGSIQSPLDKDRVKHEYWDCSPTSLGVVYFVLGNNATSLAQLETAPLEKAQDLLSLKPPSKFRYRLNTDGQIDPSPDEPTFFEAQIVLLAGDPGVTHLTFSHFIDDKATHPDVIIKIDVTVPKKPRSVY